MDIRLTGRTAIITGGSKGLGFAMAKRFAQSGANVAMLARNIEYLEKAKQEIAAVATGRVEGFSCDVANPENLEAAFAQAVSAFGAVDIVVNNAGQSRATAFETVSDDVWRDDFEQKVFGAIRLTRLAWPGMKERRWGRVINVLAVAAKAPREGSLPTSVSRAAGMALTKALSREGAPHNILVNAMLVGKIVSDQIARKYPDAVERQRAIDEVGKTIPLGRMGTAEEFANLACFLVSDQGAYITGTAINVDGGLSPVV